MNAYACSSVPESARRRTSMVVHLLEIAVRCASCLVALLMCVILARVLGIQPDHRVAILVLAGATALAAVWVSAVVEARVAAYFLRQELGNGTGFHLSLASSFRKK